MQPRPWCSPKDRSTHPPISAVLAWELEQSQVQMILAPTLADVSADRLDFRPVAGLPLVNVERPTAAKSLRWVKRSMDVLGSAFFLLMTSHILLCYAMIAIKLEDGGPIFFKQRRVGLNGEEFDCLKLRSMCVDAGLTFGRTPGQE